MTKQAAASPVRLQDYRPYPFTLHETRLEFFLDPKATEITCALDIEAKERGEAGKSDLVLDGEGLRLLDICIDGEPLSIRDFVSSESRLIVKSHALPASRFTLETRVEISPIHNTALEGLYMSRGMYTTQCEAEGFRRITYYPDRPDVMSRFRVKIHSDLPLRLSNGNPVGSGKNWSEWHDPWPKPCYLFALVAGELECVEDTFTTASGKEVDLRIYVRKGDEGRCDYAMDALRRAMRWDEMAYGREYDLGLFMIVAVDDFNMGAMENKGLNIFNSSLVLASPDTASDADYAAIESVIAHEYFHNWTGNRITCRDWFQLSLKEGLTVFRDQQFSAHERSAAVERIGQVKSLIARQFPEDAGPLAHPVRPTSYIAIDNFYTATIYEKGAELIGMMRALVGGEDYRRALDLYFERHDGEACTIEDWLSVFGDVTKRDFAQFKLWYEQSGTPHISAHTRHEGNQLLVKLEQHLPPTPGQEEKSPMLIPLAYTVYGQNGDALHSGMIEFAKRKEEIALDAPPGAVISLNQGFSAPIILSQSPASHEFLLRHDQDPFNRWQAGRDMALDILVGDTDPAPFIEGLGALLADDELEAEFRALLITLPAFDDVAKASLRAGKTPDPEHIYASTETLIQAFAAEHKEGLKAIYQDMRARNSGDLSPKAAGERALALGALRYLCAEEEGIALARDHFEGAMLMTDKIGALSLLVRRSPAPAELERFYTEFERERLVIDKWLSIQAIYSPAADALERVKSLSAHPCFKDANPNRFRSLFGAFAMKNPVAFHARDGSAYRYYAKRLIEFDAKNPQIAARLSSAFQNSWDFDETRKEHARAALEGMLATKGISSNLSEMLTRMLG